jgi:hypothetical protein
LNPRVTRRGQLKKQLRSGKLTSEKRDNVIEHKKHQTMNEKP